MLSCTCQPRQFHIFMLRLLFGFASSVKLKLPSVCDCLALEWQRAAGWQVAWGRWHNPLLTVPGIVRVELCIWPGLCNPDERLCVGHEPYVRSVK